MPWVHFSERYVFTPSADRRTSVAYPAGHTGPVTRECATKAVAAGKAKRVKTPSRTEAKGAGDGAGS